MSSVAMAVVGIELWTTILIVVAAASVLTVVVIVVAPWKQVRDEPPLDPTAEVKLLLHQDPDEPTGEFRAVTPIDSLESTDTLESIDDVEDADT